jgi:hypothetical protein
MEYSYKVYCAGAFGFALFSAFLWRFFALKAQAKQMKKKDNGRLLREFIAKKDGLMIPYARVTILAIVAMYATYVAATGIAPAMSSVLFSRTFRRADMIHALTMHPVSFTEKVEQMGEDVSKYDEYERCDSAECWASLVGLAVEQIEDTRQDLKGLEETADNGTKEIAIALDALQKSLKNYEWNESNPNPDIKTVALKLGFGGFPNLKMNDTKRLIADIKTITENSEEIRRLINETKAEITMITDLLGLDEYALQMAAQVESWGVPQDVSHVVVGAFGMAPASFFALTNSLAAEYAARKYAANVTYDLLGNRVVGPAIDSGLTAGQFLFETLLAGPHYWPHILKGWFQGALLEFTCAFYGLPVVFLSYYCHLLQSAQSFGYEYKIVRFPYLCLKECKKSLFWFGIFSVIVTGGSSFVAVMHLAYCKFNDTPLSNSAWSGRLLDQIVKTGNEHIFTRYGLIILLQLAWFGVILIVKNRTAYYKRVRYGTRGKDNLEAPRVSDKSGPFYSRIESGHKNWNRLETALWVLTLALPIVATMTTWATPSFPDSVANFIMEHPPIGDLKLKDHTATFCLALLDFATLPITARTISTHEYLM